MTRIRGGHGGWLVLALAAVLADPGTAVSQEVIAPQQRAGLERKARDLLRQAGKLYEQDQPEQATEAARQALRLYRQLYPKEEYPDGRPDLAASLNALGFCYSARGEYGRAEPLYREALALRRRLYPEDRSPGGHPDL